MDSHGGPTEELDESFEGMEQSDLGGCCCDCGHKTRGRRRGAEEGWYNGY